MSEVLCNPRMRSRFSGDKSQNQSLALALDTHTPKPHAVHRMQNASSQSTMAQNSSSHGALPEDALAVRLCHARGMSLCSCGNQPMNCGIEQNKVATSSTIQDVLTSAISHFSHTPALCHTPPGKSLPWHRCSGEIHFLL